MIAPPLESPAGLFRALRRVNRLRADGGAAGREAEEMVEALFRPSVRLAVYGSLAPGEVNHHVVRPLGGSWTDAHVRGERWHTGWGTQLGYPAMRWTEQREPLPVKLLVSENLRDAWERLDAFEGSGYRRILVPVHREAGVVAVANLYEAADA